MAETLGKGFSRRVIRSRKLTRGALLISTSIVTFYMGLPAAAQHDHDKPEAKPAILLPGMGELHHPIATKNPEAQKFFDQGLTLVYGFNRPEALRSFRRAAELDPKAAMSQWGIALALGPYINMASDPDVDLKSAFDAIQQALALKANAPGHERDYIDALAKRLSNDPKADPARLALDYANAMREVARRYPDDLDAATLFGEALMNLNRWKWWGADGKAAQGTEEAISVLELVLRRDPLHPGANHYYLHAIEESPNPERALPSAARLMGVVPGIGHLVHMPGHIFMRVGDFDLAAMTNERAVRADDEYIKAAGAGMNGYTMGYYSHNVHFIAVARAAQGRFDDSLKAADALAARVTPGLEMMPMMVDYFVPTRIFVLLRFQRWDEILKAPEPDARLVFTTCVWRFARAIALAAIGDASGAGAERAAFAAARNKVPSGLSLGNNSAASVLKVAAEVLDARLAQGDAAIDHWKRAVEAQDALSYDEPPPWYYPVRESLGGALLRRGRTSEAEAAFREDLRRNPRNPRSLFGLMESLKAQKKTTAADWVRKEFESAWRLAQVQLRVDDL